MCRLSRRPRDAGAADSAPRGMPTGTRRADGKECSHASEVLRPVQRLTPSTTGRCQRAREQRPRCGPQARHPRDAGDADMPLTAVRSHFHGTSTRSFTSNVPPAARVVSRLPSSPRSGDAMVVQDVAVIATLRRSRRWGDHDSVHSGSMPAVAGRRLRERWRTALIACR